MRQGVTRRDRRAGKFDMTFPFEVTVALLRDVKSQAPQTICELVPANASANLITTAMPRLSTIPRYVGRWR